MTPPTAYSVTREKSSPRWAAAFAAGCVGRVDHAGRLHPGPVAMFGSPARWDLLRQAQAEGRDWYYGDHGYFGRWTYFRCTRNAWQHDGIGDAGPERFERFGIEIAPWRRDADGNHVLVCPPDAAFARLMGFDAAAWKANVLELLHAATGRPVRVRERHGYTTPLSADLDGCWALVTYMSNAAVEALLAGVPVFCTGPCAARTMGLGDLRAIERPVYPVGRRQWAWNLAANQWTLPEMREGALWRAIGRE